MQTTLNQFRPITMQVHGVLDYTYGVLLMLAPWLSAFSTDAVGREMAQTFGIAVLLWSVFTDYPLGVAHYLPFRFHLWLDYIAGLALTIGPWLMPVSQRARITLIVFGIIALVVVSLTKRRHAGLPG